MKQINEKRALMLSESPFESDSRARLLPPPKTGQVVRRSDSLSKAILRFYTVHNREIISGLSLQIYVLQDRRTPYRQGDIPADFTCYSRMEYSWSPGRHAHAVAGLLGHGEPGRNAHSFTGNLGATDRVGSDYRCGRTAASSAR